MLTLKNLTNSPQTIPLADGGTRVVAAGATDSAAFSPLFCELLKLAGTFIVEPYTEKVAEQEAPRRGRPPKAKEEPEAGE